MASSLTNARPAAATFQNAWLDLAAATGDQSIVAALSGKKIRVHAVFANNAGTLGTLLFESGTATSISPTFDVVADGGGFVLPFNDVGWFETAAGAALTATTATGNSTTGVLVVYSVVTTAR
jgi:Flp pilus assembly protein CpaB